MYRASYIHRQLKVAYHLHADKDNLHHLDDNLCGAGA